MPGHKKQTTSAAVTICSDFGTQENSLTLFSFFLQLPPPILTPLELFPFLIFTAEDKSPGFLFLYHLHDKTKLFALQIMITESKRKVKQVRLSQSSSWNNSRSMVLYWVSMLKIPKFWHCLLFLRLELNHQPHPYLQLSFYCNLLSLGRKLNKASRWSVIKTHTASAQSIWALYTISRVKLAGN